MTAPTPNENSPEVTPLGPSARSAPRAPGLTDRNTAPHAVWQAPAAPPDAAPVAGGSAPGAPPAGAPVAGGSAAGVWPGALAGRPSRRELLIAAAVLGAVGLLGAPIGLVWSAIAPRATVEKTGTGSAIVVSNLEGFVAAEGWFLFLTVGYAFVATLVVWLALRQHRGPVMLVALTLGTIAASAIAWWVGSRLGLADYRDLLRAAPAGRTLERPPDLRALRTTLLAGGLVSAITSVLLAGFSARPDLQPVRHARDDPEH